VINDAAKDIMPLFKLCRMPHECNRKVLENLKSFLFIVK